LVIGINKYKYVGPLAYARHDAEEIARLTIEKFGFSKEQVTVLLDGDATREAIRSAFLSYVQKTQPDDRILVFFAGHGHTQTGIRGEVGFLVPVDGVVMEVATLIRWDELTKNADLIPAKHIFFLMDACYGGLALSRRTIPPGSMRFLKDMLQRYSRQVLTAGKADEVVADSGGTRPEHSIFTSHIIDAFEGTVAMPNGIISTNSIMAHTYQMVGNDPNSRQTPHFGSIDGDGDFIFDLAPIEQLAEGELEGSDLLVNLSPTGVPAPQSETALDTLKRLIPDPAQQIRLDDFVSGHLRYAVSSLALRNFPPSVPITTEEVSERLKKYEATVEDLAGIVVLVSRWGSNGQLALVEKIFARLAEVDKLENGGFKSWLRLGWYPIVILMYAAGISALSAQKYEVLKWVFLTRVHSDQSLTGKSEDRLVVPTSLAIVEMESLFKKLPAHQGQLLPLSEYMFKLLQPILEDILFLGRSYEPLFDKFEVIFALECSNNQVTDGHLPWGPPGRFAWKYRRDPSGPFQSLLEEANQQTDNWPPLRAGLFNGSLVQFRNIAAAYEDDLRKFHLR
jgi:Caspase domain